MQTPSEDLQFNEEELAKKVEKKVVEFIEEREALHGYPWRYTYGELAAMFIDPAIASIIFWKHGWGFEVIPIDETETVKYEIRVPDAPQKEEKSDNKE